MPFVIKYRIDWNSDSRWKINTAANMLQLHADPSFWM